MYEVIKYFTDLQDNNHPYEVGDAYPREGLSVSESRIAELSGSNNKQHAPLIREVSFSKADINRMNGRELRALAESLGVDSTDDLTVSELKTLLIDYFA